MENFYSSMLANGLLALAYAGYKVIDRCSKSQCRYGAAGLEFDLGEPATDCPATELGNLAELLKKRSQHYLQKKEDAAAQV